MASAPLQRNVHLVLTHAVCLLLLVMLLLMPLLPSPPLPLLLL